MQQHPTECLMIIADFNEKTSIRENQYKTTVDNYDLRKRNERGET